MSKPGDHFSLLSTDEVGNLRNLASKFDATGWRRDENVSEPVSNIEILSPELSVGSEGGGCDAQFSGTGIGKGEAWA